MPHRSQFQGMHRSPKLHQFIGLSEEQREVDKKLQKERDAAEAEMAYRWANLQMPADIRERAQAWRMEAFFDVLWNNAFQAGYREAMRDRNDDR